MLVFHTPLSLLHNPPHEILSGCVQPYFESPERYHRILAALLFVAPTSAPDSPVAFEERRLEWAREEVHTPELERAVRAVHDAEYLAFLDEVYNEWVAEGGSRQDAALPETFLRADMLLEPSDGSEGRGSAIARIGSRPPGHHATSTLCGGYCFLNAAAVAAREAQRLLAPSRSSRGEKARIAILDVDYHHGNGTSKTFYDDPSVLYLSLHGSPDYPWYTGAASEMGGPNARGTNVNVPLPLGTRDEEYLAALEGVVSRAAEWAPEVLIVSLGVDTFAEDPLTDFKLTMSAYPPMGAAIARVRARTLFVMEGGYCLEAIGGCVRGVLVGFERART
ncbi:hypothetical protein JCM10450v2_007841 [Rhodotorula kratochvilovae]